MPAGGGVSAQSIDTCDIDKIEQELREIMAGKESKWVEVELMSH